MHTVMHRMSPRCSPSSRLIRKLMCGQSSGRAFAIRAQCIRLALPPCPLSYNRSRREVEPKAAYPTHCSRSGHSCFPSCHDTFLRPVQWVVPCFQQLCHESLAQKQLPKHDFIYLLQAARAFAGDQFWGPCLDHLADGEFPGVCPNCKKDLYLVIGEHGFFATAEEWIRRPPFQRSVIEPNNGSMPEVGRWLYEQAQLAQQDSVADWIRYVFGRSVCPSCGHKFAVQDAIVDACQ